MIYATKKDAHPRDSDVVLEVVYVSGEADLKSSLWVSIKGLATTAAIDAAVLDAVAVDVKRHKRGTFTAIDVVLTN